MKQFLRGSLASCLAACAMYADTTPQTWPAGVEKALLDAGTNRSQLVSALDRAPAKERDALFFLIENMPNRDLQTLSASFLLEHVSLSEQALASAPWRDRVPRDLFLNDVLPYACVNERRDAWRKVLRERCVELVRDCSTTGTAACRLNERLFPLLKVKYSTKRWKADQSPFETMESGLASCTGLSILLVDACRSVGVPARLAGTPNWANRSGNHTWVEVWDDGWHFLGAAEPDPGGLDHGWFAGNAASAQSDSREHAIYAVSFRKTAIIFPLVWAPFIQDVFAVNVTESYTRNRQAAR